MKAKTASPETAVLTAERKLHNTWVYIKRHWQLYHLRIIRRSPVSILLPLM
jgi:putative aldouronate transport system permease protein